MKKLLRFLLVGCSSVWYGSIYAQVAVTAINESPAAATTGNQYVVNSAPNSAAITNITHNWGTNTTLTANIKQVNGFTANSLNFTYITNFSSVVRFQRKDHTNGIPVSGNRVLLFGERPSGQKTPPANNGTLNFIPPYVDQMEVAFDQRVYNLGTDNVFLNEDDTPNNNKNNIERVDVVFQGGLATTALNNVGFAVFDRGSGDPFKIAAITGINSSGVPTSYATLVSVSAAQFGGSGLKGGDIPFAIVRKDPADTYLRYSGSVNQNIRGTFLSFNDLGITSGQVIYGYSLFPNDVSVPAQTLTNVATFPSTTSTGNGGLDLLAITGVAAVNVADVTRGDSDQDGIADNIDIDDDNDGISDTTEGISTNRDTDGDGIPDYLDLDSDNDGIPDVVEAAPNAANADPDGDGRLVATGSSGQVDANGLANILSGTPRTPNNADGDSVADYLDLDSDNDGIADVREVGGADGDNNGIIGTGSSIVDVDEDGWSDLADADDPGLASGTPIHYGNGDDNKDGSGTTADNVPDYRDVDSDNDGIADAREVGNADANNDGRKDGTPINGVIGTFVSVLPDADGDGVPNYLDLDSDNDGIFDAREARAGANPDTNNDGRVNGTPNADGSVIAFVAPENGDGDGVPDYLDLDSDNDSVNDVNEAGTGLDPDNNGIIGTGLVPAVNVDGVATFAGTTSTPTDTDGDSIPDFREVDRDNNGIFDIVDAGNDSFDVGPVDGRVDDITDTDGDGIANVVDGRGGFGDGDANDVDADGIPNVTDVDDDNDGILDTVEGNSDPDGDGIINSRDLDSDNDGIADVVEASANNANADPDGDGRIGTGIVTVDANGLATVLGGVGITPVNTDGDTVADYLDLDSDNDGIADVIEVRGTDPDNNGIIGTGTTITDDDSDGWSDLADADDSGPAIGTVIHAGNGDDNNDGAGDATDAIPNHRELDSDNDGIADVVEAAANAANADSDNDGRLSTTVGSTGIPTGGLLNAPDSDGDGLPDFLDLDSDNDGFSDLLEVTFGSSGLDADGNGRIGGTGAIADTDGDGWSNITDPSNGGTIIHAGNGDDNFDNGNNTTDAVPNYRDVDSDNDGISDLLESGNTTVADANNDGRADGTANPTTGVVGGLATTANNADGDARPDYIDLDSDNDGLFDIAESGLSFTDATLNNVGGDGMADGTVGSSGAITATLTSNALDSDGDEVLNFRDLDSDNDNIADINEIGVSTPTPTSSPVVTTPNITDGADNNGRVGNGAFVDADNDGLADAIDRFFGSVTNGGRLVALRNTDGAGGGDTVPDYIDLDSDNDGISDLAEATTNPATDADNDGRADGTPNVNGLVGTLVGTLNNTDGDNRPDYRDLDSDNDGIYDLLESGITNTDANDDGRIDAAALSGGVGNITSNPNDADGDGVRNFRDLDSDDDGLGDIVEAGGADGDNDGRIGTGAITDADNDGVADSIDKINGSVTNGTSLPVPDTDGDSVRNYLDIDSDDDSISDLIESVSGISTDAGNDGRRDASANANGIRGTLTAIPTNTDGDARPDYLDLDADNDGIYDLVESGTANTDANNDGVLDGTANANGLRGTLSSPPADHDGDNVYSFRDLDSDNDSIADVIEAGGTDGDNDGRIGTGAITDADNDGVADSIDKANGSVTNGTALSVPDTDGDGVRDFRDIDSDGDSIADVVENGQADGDNNGRIGTNPVAVDANGVATALSSTFPSLVSTDADGVPDYLDLDSDNDGLSDLIESGSTGNADADANGRVDGSADANGLVGSLISTPNNADGDARPDYRDLDSDNDGIYDLIESGTANTDADNNGIVDGTANANGVVGTLSTNPVDTDSDGVRDFRDLDSDNDSIADVIEAGGTDGDNDGRIGTGAITDADNDGVADSIDKANGSVTNGTALSVPDTDGDGVRDFRDLDTDNDGIADITENGNGASDTTTPDGRADGAVDANGVPSVFGGTFTAVADKDGDTVPNYRDLDSDNDGISDLREGVLGSISDANNDGRIDGAVNANGVPTGGTFVTGNSAVNTDTDAIPDYLDLDSDNDGITDVREAFPIGINNDTDNNGIYGTGAVPSVDVNGVPVGASSFVSPANFDDDAVPDFRDLDSDNDGINDVREAFITNEDGDGDGYVGTGITDTDNDGILDAADNLNGFGDNADPALVNSDADPNPDYRDLDSDNDGINDVKENGGTDADGDGLVDGDDTDLDGIRSAADGSSTKGDSSDPAPQDTDGDGIPNFRDIKSNGNGVGDPFDSQNIGYGGTPSADANVDGIVDDGEVGNIQDADGDGIMDSIDENDAAFGEGITPLPVRFLTLDAQRVGARVRVNWTTTLEINNQLYTIERSSDGRSFAAIGEVSPQRSGAPQAIRHYTFADEQPLVGWNYYRIRQRDYDGKVMYSSIVSVNFDDIEAALIYPNPTYDNAQITLNSLGDEQVRLELLNTQGSQIDTFTWRKPKGKASQVLQLAHLPAGVYFLRVQSAQRTELLRVVKK